MRFHVDKLHFSITAKYDNIQWWGNKSLPGIVIAG